MLDEPVFVQEKTKEDLFDAELTIYPNPTKGLSFLKYESNSEEPVTFYVMDNNGKLVYTENQDNFYGSLRTSFTFENLSAGTYYFVVDQGTNSSKSKVLYVGQ